jgi:hypothetical protein
MRNTHLVEVFDGLSDLPADLKLLVVGQGVGVVSNVVLESRGALNELEQQMNLRVTGSTCRLSSKQWVSLMMLG